MNNRQLTLLLIASMIISGIIGYFVATLVIIPRIDLPSIPIIIPPLEVIHAYITLKSVISFINLVLLIFMLGIYIDIYRSMRTRFTLGLVTMLLLLMLYALTSNPIVFSRFGFQTVGLGPFTILPDIFTSIALLVLFYLSLE